MKYSFILIKKGLDGELYHVYENDIRLGYVEYFPRIDCYNVQLRRKVREESLYVSDVFFEWEDNDDKSKEVAKEFELYYSKKIK